MAANESIDLAMSSSLHTAGIASVHGASRASTRHTTDAMSSKPVSLIFRFGFS